MLPPASGIAGPFAAAMQLSSSSTMASASLSSTASQNWSLSKFGQFTGDENSEVSPLAVIAVVVIRRPVSGPLYVQAWGGAGWTAAVP